MRAAAYADAACDDAAYGGDNRPFQRRVSVVSPWR